MVIITDKEDVELLEQEDERQGKENTQCITSS